MILEAWGALVVDEKLKDPTLLQVASSVNRSVIDVLIKWSLQSGFLPLVTSESTDHQVEDLAVATSGWELPEQDVETLDALGKHPFFSNGIDIAGPG